jgi:hypothetical protein
MPMGYLGPAGNGKCFGRAGSEIWQNSRILSVFLSRMLLIIYFSNN